MSAIEIRSVPYEPREPTPAGRQAASISSFGVTLLVHLGVVLVLVGIKVVPGLPQAASEPESDPLTIAHAETVAGPAATPPSVRPSPPIDPPPAAEPSLPAPEAVHPKFAVEDPELPEFVPDEPEVFDSSWPEAETEQVPPARPEKRSVASKPATKPRPVREVAVKPAARPQPKPAKRVSAVPVRSPRPSYPRSARQQELEGTVYIRASIDRSGKVAEASLSRSSGHSSLDEAARRAVARWKFRPATVGGVATASKVIVPVKFALQ